MKFARRLDAVPPYLFAELERKIAEKRATGVDVISLGIGDPDLPSPPPVVEAMQRAVADPRTHRYPTNQGLPSFRDAVAEFYTDRFGVTIDPATEVIPVLGGKEGVAHVALACLDPGDVCLSPEPGYPPYTSGPVFAGASVHYLPLRPERSFMPDLAGIPAEARAAANLLFLNYPNNPTGATVAAGFFQEAVEFAGSHDLIVIHDASYTELAFDGYRPPSFLETPGAREVGAEIFSLSKGWNLTGWRIGWIAGNSDVVERYRQLKTNIDSGMSEAVQVAGVAALRESRSFPTEMSEIYQRRRDLMVNALAAIGLPAKPPQATPYIWVGVAAGYTSAGFTELILEEAGVVVSPGPSFGPSGEGFVRISLTVPDEQLEEAATRIASSLDIGARA
jgi:LL-diaminopimelate aminotransferase